MSLATIRTKKADSVEMLTTQQAANVIGISAIRVRQLIDKHIETDGEEGIRAEKMGPRMWLVYRDSALAYKKNRKPAGRPRKLPSRTQGA